ncbi:MAG TPA: hypothetical protein VGB57_07430 [Allosphingosinicella sp.]|jgi:hypothetical protein
MSNKHPSPDEQPVELRDDLDRDPGIGQSKAFFARDGKGGGHLVKGDNTVEGDIENDGGDAGGVDPELGRDH